MSVLKKYFRRHLKKGLTGHKICPPPLIPSIRYFFLRRRFHLTILDNRLIEADILKVSAFIFGGSHFKVSAFVNQFSEAEDDKPVFNKGLGPNRLSLAREHTYYIYKNYQTLNPIPSPSLSPSFGYRSPLGRPSLFRLSLSFPQPSAARSGLALSGALGGRYAGSGGGTRTCSTASAAQQQRAGAGGGGHGGSGSTSRIRRRRH